MVDKIVQTYDGKFILSTYTSLEGGQAKTIQYIKVFTKLFPEGKIFKIWLFLEGRILLIGEDKKLWIYYVIPRKLKFKGKPFLGNIIAFPCISYCNKNINRTHLSCLWCRKRRIIEGKVDNPVKVDLYIDVVHKDIKMCRLRQYLIKNLRSLIEFIGGL